MVRKPYRGRKKKLEDFGEYWGAMADGTTRRERDYDLFPENEIAVRLFCACATQWRIGMSGDLHGLDYSAVASVMSIEEISDQKSALHKLRTIEMAAMQSINERSRIRAEAHKKAWLT